MVTLLKKVTTITEWSDNRMECKIECVLSNGGVAGVKHTYDPSPDSDQLDIIARQENVKENCSNSFDKHIDEMLTALNKLGL